MPTFCTDGDGDFDDEFEQRANFGVSLAWMGGGIIGFEADLGYTPNFFENTTGPDDFEFGDNSVTTLMANLMIGIPIGGQTGGGFRPYVVGGVGLVKATADDPLGVFDIDSNSFGFDVGGGAMFFFSDNFGLRADVRYFRSFDEAKIDTRQRHPLRFRRPEVLARFAWRDVQVLASHRDGPAKAGRYFESGVRL